MASLSSSFATAPTLVAGKFRRSISATAKPDLPIQVRKKGEDLVQEALLSSDPKRPWLAPLFSNVIRGSRSGRRSVDLATESDGTERPKVATNRSGLTAEKARVLRKELRAMESWHDQMYHSAIASRLASPDQS